MEILPIASILHTVKEQDLNNPRKHYFRLYYSQNKPKYLLSQQKHRLKLKSLKPKKPLSTFQQKKQNLLLKLLVNHKSFVPVAPKLKHPTTKNWNANNYWYKLKLDLDNLPRGCVRIYEDNWNGCYIIWLDIDQKKWTKLAKLFRCGYVKSPKGHIRIPVLVQNLEGLKTGALYHKGTKIGDAKLSGEVMLPGQAYYDKEGNFLGYYEYKAWGTFFPLNNKIWTNVGELFCYLKQISGIEYKTMREHFSIANNKGKTYVKNVSKIFTNFSAREPPGWKREINKFSKIGIN